MKWCGALVSETVGVHIEDVKNKMHLCNCIRAPLHCKCIVQVVDYWRSFQTVGKAACGKDATPPPLSRTFHLYSRRFFAPAVLCGAHLQLVKRWQHGEDTKLLAKLGMVS